MNWSYYIGRKGLIKLLALEKPDMIIHTFPMFGFHSFYLEIISSFRRLVC